MQKQESVIRWRATGQRFACARKKYRQRFVIDAGRGSNRRQWRHADPLGYLSLFRSHGFHFTSGT
jgi:hypothetical protein